MSAYRNPPSGLDLASCRRLGQKIRRHVVCMTHRAQSAHVGTSLSMADLLAVLYGSVLRAAGCANGRTVPLLSLQNSAFSLSRGLMTSIRTAPAWLAILLIMAFPE